MTGRDELLDEAIAKAKADGDVQLAEWLRQARGADAAARWYTEKLRDASCTIRKLLDENSKLRKLVKRYHRLATGTDELWSWQSVYAELRELGIEVG